jgi:pimeloyl-ACP methyl ester carboxylesterase
MTVAPAPANPLDEAVKFFPLGGEGAPAALLHGFGADHLTWLANQQAVAGAAAAFAVDLPGHGRSSMDVGDGALRTLAGIVAEAIDRKSLRNLHLIGHSLGAGVALQLADARPDLVASLVLITPPGLGKEIDRNFLTALPRLTTPEETLPLLQSLVVRPSLINKHVAAHLLSQLETPGARQALVQIADALAAGQVDIDRVLSSEAVRVKPRLLVWGEADAINPPDAERISAFGAETVIVPQVGHLPHIEAARTFNETVVAFLGRRRAP